MNKKLVISVPILITIIISVIITTIIMRKPEEPSSPNSSPETNQTGNSEEKSVDKIYISVNHKKFEVALADNSATKALVEKLSTGDITVEAEDYDNFEKVGSLGFSLPTSDERITTKPGDLMLYNGSNITLFYGENTWSYTKLGHINASQSELKSILGDGDVILVLSL